MDEIVEQGFARLKSLVAETKEAQKTAAGEIEKENAKLLAMMAHTVGEIVGEIGQEFLLKAKMDTKGELYDQKYYAEKMIILGKSADPIPFRPDNPTKKVDQQFCVLSENGDIMELMFSNDGFIIDTYTSKLTAEDAIHFYGYDIIYMLYSAMRDYALAQEDVLDALNLTLGFIQRKNEE